MNIRPVPFADRTGRCIRLRINHRPRRRVRIAGIAAALLLCGLPTLVAAGPIGVPYSSISLTTYDESLNLFRPTISINSVDNGNPGDDLLARLNWPNPRGDFYSGNVIAAVVDGGKPYWIDGSSPSYTGELPQPPGTAVGGRGDVKISQSFRRERNDAVLDFTYSSGLLQTYRDIEVGHNCAGCTLAQVGWTVEVLVNNLLTPIWSQQQFARLINNDGALSLTVGGSHSGIGIINPDWSWNCALCGGPAGALGEARLMAPYTGHVDLRNIPFVPGLPAELQTEFTVRFTMSWEAYDRGSWGQALAYVQDPLGGADSGVSITMDGLLPTNNPIGVVPEPAPWALWTAGLAAVAGLARRRGATQRG